MDNVSDVVVCGFPRSGTSLLYALMLNTVSSHALPINENGYASYQAAFVKQTTGRPVVTKKPSDIIRAANGDILDNVPLIIMVRDIRDVLLSRHIGLTDRGIDDFFIDADKKYERPENDTDLPQKTGPGLLEYCRAIEIVIKRRIAFSKSNFVVVRYEDLITDPDKLQSFVSVLGIDYKPNAKFSDWDGMAEKVSPQQTDIIRFMNGVRDIDPTNTQKWRLPQHFTRVQEQFSRFPELFSWLDGLGYETSCEWFQPFVDNPDRGFQIKGAE